MPHATFVDRQQERAQFNQFLDRNRSAGYAGTVGAAGQVNRPHKLLEIQTSEVSKTSDVYIKQQDSQMSSMMCT